MTTSCYALFPHELHPSTKHSYHTFKKQYRTAYTAGVLRRCGIQFLPVRSTGKNWIPHHATRLTACSVRYDDA